MNTLSSRWISEIAERTKLKAGLVGSIGEIANRAIGHTFEENWVGICSIRTNRNARRRLGRWISKVNIAAVAQTVSLPVVSVVICWAGRHTFLGRWVSVSCVADRARRHASPGAAICEEKWDGRTLSDAGSFLAVSKGTVCAAEDAFFIWSIREISNRIDRARSHAFVGSWVFEETCRTRRNTCLSGCVSIHASSAIVSAIENASKLRSEDQVR